MKNCQINPEFKSSQLPTSYFVFKSTKGLVYMGVIQDGEPTGVSRCSIDFYLEVMQEGSHFLYKGQKAYGI